jgi:hypothetical protein
MIDESSASGTAPDEISKMCRRWAAPSRRGRIGAGAGLVAGAAVAHEATICRAVRSVKSGSVEERNSPTRRFTRAGSNNAP